MKCISVFYPSKDNDAFDHEFYRQRHAPLIENILGKSLHKIEVRKGTPAPDGTAPLYTAVVSIWIADWEAYEKAMAGRVMPSNSYRLLPANQARRLVRCDREPDGSRSQRTTRPHLLAERTSLVIPNFWASSTPFFSI